MYYMRREHALIVLTVFGFLGAFLFAPQDAYAGAAFVQATTGHTETGSSITTSSINTAASGNSFIVVVEWAFGDGQNYNRSMTVTDNKGNAYIPLAKYSAPGSPDHAIQVFYKLNGTGGSGHTFTATPSDSAADTTIRIIAHEVSGLAASSAVDQSSSDTVTVSTTPSLGPVTTTVDGEYIFAAIASLDGIYAAVSPYTERASVDDGGGVFQLQTQDNVQTSAGSVSSSWTNGGTTANMSVMVTFSPTSLTTGLRKFPMTNLTPNGTTTVMTDAFTPFDNSLLVVAVSGLDGPGSVGSRTLAVSGGGLIWTKQGSRLDGGGNYVTQIWTAPVTTGSSMRLTYGTFGANSEVHVHVYDYTGYNTSSPIGTMGSSSASTNSGSFSFSLNGAPALTSDVLATAIADVPSAFTSGTGWDLQYLNRTTNDYQQIQTRTNSVSTTVTWDNITTGDGPFAVAVEVKAAPTASATTGRVIHLRGHVRLHGHVQFSM